MLSGAQLRPESLDWTREIRATTVIVATSLSTTTTAAPEADELGVENIGVHETISITILDLDGTVVEQSP